ncbi:MAG TPA: TolC family protein [Pirellulales bacterium]|nr:TolC family protein [Pirellulales bacterium]
MPPLPAAFVKSTGLVLVAALTCGAAPFAHRLLAQSPPAAAVEQGESPAGLPSAETADAWLPEGPPDDRPAIEHLPEVDAPAPDPGPPGDPRLPSLPPGDTYRLDLLTALQLADRANPNIGIARQAIAESLARQESARVLLLPSLTGGASYHQHTGNVQQNDGSMLWSAQQSAYFGGGAGGALGSQTIAIPAVRIIGHVGDAIFEPLAARQQVTARNFEARATFNSILLDVSVAYLDLLAAEAQLEVLRRSQIDAAAFVRVAARFAEVHQGRQADANRAKAEARLIDAQVQTALERVGVSAANLARLLTLDPSVRLQTVGGPIPTLQLVDPGLSPEQLMEIGLRQRPEVAARSAQLAEVETRLRQERSRPFFPTISLGFSAGSFGGGGDVSVPIFGDFAGRTDFDAVAYWTLQNFGAGNVARAHGRRAQTGQASWERTRTVNQVRREVAEAFAQSEAARVQIDVSARRLVEAEDGFREEFLRIRGGEGLPLELLDNLTRAIAARQTMVTSVIAYDQSQFRLFVALGQPPTMASADLRPLGPQR